ncbi:MAG: hypothetical protein E7561_02400 [Ruminococcaceae bacterium]|nr:hypothetical protein [Oscillospiraceae bacterium]
MKTRIISGIVMGVIVAAVLLIGMLWNPVIITLAISILAAGAAYELLHNAIGITSKPAIIGAGIYSSLAVFSINYTFWAYFTVGVLYFIYAVVIVLKNHKEFNIAKIAAVVFMPLGLSFAFVSLEGVINLAGGIYYLLLLLNFSSVCDMGAYFTGVTIGKHKLCPEISPKKTIEGAIGGIVSSMIVTVILTLCFKKSILLPVVLTIPFCVLGILGDLFASIIKRSVDLKDYGNLIPGHGGILDRVDSILMIAPPLFILISHGVL